MASFFDTLLHGDLMPTAGGPETALLMLLLAFCLGHVVGWVYMWSHSGLSYSRMFVASLVVMPVLVGLVMMLMSGSVFIAFGMLAVFAVVRFRNVLKDTRDTAFILWAVIMGMAVGTMRFSTAIFGCGFLSLVFLYLRYTAFGSRLRFDVVLNLRITGDLVEGLKRLKAAFQRHATKAELASERNLTNAGLELSYRLLLRNPARGHELVAELREMEGVAEPAMFTHSDEAEF
jgi:hypothetical protein